MTAVTAEQTQAYIEAYYLTRQQLSLAAGISEARILELVEARCIPPHAYEARPETTYISSFGSYRLPAASLFYYHPRHVDWIDRAETLAAGLPLTEVAVKVKEGFEADIEAALDGQPLPWPDGLGLVWDYLMDGTWSLCLKDFDIPGLVQKEVARRTIAEVEDAAAGRPISDDERERLRAAVRRYDAVALPFSPHEVGESSRCLEVNAVVRKYRLA